MKMLITSFSYISLGEFSSFNHVNYFQYFYLGCGAPNKRVEEWCLFNYFLLGCEALGILDWLVFCTGCDTRLSGWRNVKHPLMSSVPCWFGA